MAIEFPSQAKTEVFINSDGNVVVSQSEHPMHDSFVIFTTRDRAESVAEAIINMARNHAAFIPEKEDEE